jgi:threonine dehydrogenase-like Zn-dependent dehydrogenase
MTVTPGIAAPAAAVVAVLEAPGRIVAQSSRLPEPLEGEVLVRLEGCGVCASSLPLWEGRPWFEYPLEPGAPGHEGWGVEVETGRRVALLGLRSFAEYECVSCDLVVPLPPELGEKPFPGEALGCAMNVLARTGVGPGDTVGVVGAGFLGLLLAQLCVGAGARTLVFSRRETGRRLARNVGAETPSEAHDESCDVAIEAGGVQETLELAGRLCRVRGRLVLAGFHQDGRRSVDVQLWNWRGLDVVNAHERDPAIRLEGIREAAAAVVDGRLDPAPLYTHTRPLVRLHEAFELMRRRPEGFVKALVVPR